MGRREKIPCTTLHLHNAISRAEAVSQLTHLEINQHNVPAAQEPSEEEDEVPSIHRQDDDVENVSDVFVCMDDGWDSDEEEYIAGDKSRQSKLNGHSDEVSLGSSLVEGDLLPGGKACSPFCLD
jgi:hypothetical protein